MNEVLKFIDKFNRWDQVIECFTNGNCYWFAYILVGRFPSGTIVYDEIENHFGCLIDDKVYDITGDVTKCYNWETWQEVYLRDPLHGKRILRDCILKEGYDD